MLDNSQSWQQIELDPDFTARNGQEITDFERGARFVLVVHRLASSDTGQKNPIVAVALTPRAINGFAGIGSGPLGAASRESIHLKLRRERDEQLPAQ